MKKFNTTKEIRDEIDELDLRIIELISKRKNLVFEVVKLKSKDQIVDKEGLTKSYKRLNLEAKKRNPRSSGLKGYGK